MSHNRVQDLFKDPEKPKNGERIHHSLDDDVRHNLVEALGLTIDQDQPKGSLHVEPGTTPEEYEQNLFAVAIISRDQTREKDRSEPQYAHGVFGLLIRNGSKVPFGVLPTDTDDEVRSNVRRTARYLFDMERRREEREQ